MAQLGPDGRERPIAFFSKGLDRKEVDPKSAAIKTRELELYALLLATRKWRHYLYGRAFEWHTDHKPLLWEEKNPEGGYTEGGHVAVRAEGARLQECLREGRRERRRRRAQSPRL